MGENEKPKRWAKTKKCGALVLVQQHFVSNYVETKYSYSGIRVLKSTWLTSDSCYNLFREKCQMKMPDALWYYVCQTRLHSMPPRQRSFEGARRIGAELGS